MTRWWKVREARMPLGLRMPALVDSEYTMQWLYVGKGGGDLNIPSAALGSPRFMKARMSALIDSDYTIVYFHHGTPPLIRISQVYPAYRYLISQPLVPYCINDMWGPPPLRRISQVYPHLSFMVLMVAYLIVIM